MAQMIRQSFSIFGFLALTACAQTIDTPDIAPPKSGPQPIESSAPGPLSGRDAVNNFITVVETVEPVAERVCRQRAPTMNCDFQIVVDDAVNAPPNAFQTVDARGRPILAFTVPLIAKVRNQDEMAFIMAHEAAHHIEGHLGRLQRNASLGAEVAGLIFGATDAESLRTAQQLGAAIGGRAYSKDFELEADALGTVITFTAGYDPLIGAKFFERIPDPGDVFLGTHPGNDERVATVRRVAASLR